MKKRFLSVLLVFAMAIFSLVMPTEAASNPYPKWQNINGWGETVRCTYYAWQQVYDNLGIALPGWGNGGTWLTSATNAGYLTGTTPQPKSLVVWTDGGFGHVEYVTEVNGNNIIVNGGGYYNLDHSPHKQSGQDTGVWTGVKKPGTAGSIYYGQTLAGYIYFGQINPPPTKEPSVTFTTDASRQSIGDTNAILATRIDVNGASIADIVYVGISLYDVSGHQLAVTGESVHYTDSYMLAWYNVNDELHYTLTPGTTYQYRFYVQIGQDFYRGPFNTFTTSGSAPHSHSLTHYLPKAGTESATGNIEYWYCADCEKYYSDASATNEIIKAQTVVAKITHVHTLAHITAKSATEKDTGNIEYWRCVDCGKYFSDANAQDEITQGQTVVAKLAHIHQLAFVPAKAATPTASGNINYWYCNDCGKYFFDADATTELSRSQTIISVLDTPKVQFEKQTIYYQDYFSDVPANQWYTDSIAEAFEFGLMKGNSKTTFSPYGDVTVAEAITMAARIHSIYTTGSETFAQSEKWYQVYLDYAYENGIISRAFYNSDVTQKATRAQFAEIFANSMPEEGLRSINQIDSGAIPDVELSAIYAPGVYQLYRAGILTGSDANGTFNPQTYITRAEAAAIVSRMANSDKRVSIQLKASKAQSGTRITINSQTFNPLSGDK